VNGTNATQRSLVLPLIASLITVATVLVLLVGHAVVQMAALAAICLGLVVYIAVVHPRAPLLAFGAVLGAAPYMHVPGTELPAMLALCAWTWLVYLLLPETELRWGWPELAVAAVAVAVALSVVATGMSTRALIEATAWLVATSLVVPLCRMPGRLRASLCRAFASSAVVGSVIGFAVIVGAPGWLWRVLSPLGYDPARNVRQISNEALTERLTGTYLEPNVAGLILLVAVIVAVIHLRGRWRVVAVSIISLALLLTLSRAAIGAAAVGGLVVVVRTPQYRTQLVALGAGAGAVALLIPRVRDRLLGSFGSDDVGFSDRIAALRAFPDHVNGHWWWGLGWNRPEFRDAGAAAATNFVANGPLLTVYRGGIILGTLVTLVVVILLIRAWTVAGHSFAAALLAGGLIGIGLVAFQLDFPIVNQAPATAVASLLIALTLVAGRTAERIPGRAPATHDA
jgi:hypothetical protein